MKKCPVLTDGDLARAVAELIRATSTELGWSLSELARRSGVPPTSVIGLAAHAGGGSTVGRRGRTARESPKTRVPSGTKLLRILAALSGRGPLDAARAALAPAAKAPGNLPKTG